MSSCHCDERDRWGTFWSEKRLFQLNCVAVFSRNMFGETDCFGIHLHTWKFICSIDIFGPPVLCLVLREAFEEYLQGASQESFGRNEWGPHVRIINKVWWRIFQKTLSVCHGISCHPTSFHGFSIAWSKTGMNWNLNGMHPIYLMRFIDNHALENQTLMA